MRRIFADLHLCPDLKDAHRVSEMISKASKLGYRLIAMPFSPNTTAVETEKLRTLCREANLDTASRVDLNPRTPKELLYDLRRLRRRFEVVAVVCRSKNVARQAARDRRVDILSFPSLDFRRFFDRAEAELASSAFACLEIDVGLLFNPGEQGLPRVLSSLRRATAIANQFRIPTVLSSGVSDAMLLRKPMELAALASLFDMDRDNALKAVSENPLKIVERNREKLSSQFVAPGIRVVRKGKDC